MNTNLKNKAAPVFSTSAAEQGDPAVSVLKIVPQFIEKAADAFEARLTDAQRKQLNGRLAKARQIALAGDVHFTEEENTFKVRSSSTKGNYYYQVNLAGKKTCTCPDITENHMPTCKHILAAYYTQQAYEQQDQDWPEDAVQKDLQNMAAAYDEAVASGILPKPERDLATVPDPEPVAVVNQAAKMVTYEAIIYADYTFPATGEIIPVEILNTEDGDYHIRALPKYNEETGSFEPRFPFPSPFGTNVAYSTIRVAKTHLGNVKIYRPQF